MNEMVSVLMGNRAPIAQPKASSAKQANATIKNQVAERFVAARELNGFSQIEAATKFGYKNSTQLNLWERAQRIPPVGYMIVASVVYGVSLDYLCGLSDEPERDPRTAEQKAMIRSMEDILRANAESVAQALTAYTRSGGTSMLTAKALHAKAADAAASVRRFVEINGAKFENMRGSATVLHACVELEALVREAGSLIKRHDGLKEDALRRRTPRSSGGYPLFETPEYRQSALAIGAEKGP